MSTCQFLRLAVKFALLVSLIALPQVSCRIIRLGSGSSGAFAPLTRRDESPAINELSDCTLAQPVKAPDFPGVGQFEDLSLATRLLYPEFDGVPRVADTALGGQLLGQTIPPMQTPYVISDLVVDHPYDNNMLKWFFEEIIDLSYVSCRLVEQWSEESDLGPDYPRLQDFWNLLGGYPNGADLAGTTTYLKQMKDFLLDPEFPVPNGCNGQGTGTERVQCLWAATYAYLYISDTSWAWRYQLTNIRIEGFLKNGVGNFRINGDRLATSPSVSPFDLHLKLDDRYRDFMAGYFIRQNKLIWRLFASFKGEQFMADLPPSTPQSDIDSYQNVWLPLYGEVSFQLNGLALLTQEQNWKVRIAGTHRYSPEDIEAG